jgi:hypothetical protein
MALILECDMTQSIASDSTPREQGITSVRLNLMRQNNFRIFKEHRCRYFYPRREATHAPHAAHVWTHAIDRSRQVGGASRDRTGDLLLAKQALSQLSYGP